jgi:hypothetical protein
MSDLGKLIVASIRARAPGRGASRYSPISLRPPGATPEDRMTSRLAGLQAPVPPVWRCGSATGQPRR